MNSSNYRGCPTTQRFTRYMCTSFLEKAVTVSFIHWGLVKTTCTVLTISYNCMGNKATMLTVQNNAITLTFVPIKFPIVWMFTFPWWNLTSTNTIVIVFLWSNFLTHQICMFVSSNTQVYTDVGSIVLVDTITDLCFQIYLLHLTHSHTHILTVYTLPSFVPSCWDLEMLVLILRWVTMYNIVYVAIRQLYVSLP